MGHDVHQLGDAAVGAASAEHGEAGAPQGQGRPQVILGSLGHELGAPVDEGQVQDGCHVRYRLPVDLHGVQSDGPVEGAFELEDVPVIGADLGRP